MTKELTDKTEVLFRQIHPNFYHGGEPSSQPFMPTSKDLNNLSVDRSALTSAADSHSLFVSNGYASAAVYGVTVGEFGAEGLPGYSDPLPATTSASANPAHAIVDYSAYSGNQQKTRAKRLKLSALKRGCLHPKS